MVSLEWEMIDKNAFAKFLRDISESSVNLKHMIEDMERKEASF